LRSTAARRLVSSDELTDEFCAPAAPAEAATITFMANTILAVIRFMQASLAHRPDSARVALPKLIFFDAGPVTATKKRCHIGLSHGDISIGNPACLLSLAHPIFVAMRNLGDARHCEERSDEAIQLPSSINRS
jgi:hypothetical protein